MKVTESFRYELLLAYPYVLYVSLKNLKYRPVRHKSIGYIAFRILSLCHLSFPFLLISPLNPFVCLLASLRPLNSPTRFQTSRPYQQYLYAVPFQPILHDTWSSKIQELQFHIGTTRSADRRTCVIFSKCPAVPITWRAIAAAPSSSGHRRDLSFYDSQHPLQLNRLSHSIVAVLDMCICKSTASGWDCIFWRRRMSLPATILLCSVI